MQETQYQYGRAGEETARIFLQERGYKWLASHVASRWGELDLVMEDGKTVVFVEVKSRRSRHYGAPEEAVTPLKQAHLVKAALFFIKSRSWQNRLIRFDVVALSDGQIKHIKDAFWAGPGYYF